MLKVSKEMCTQGTFRARVKPDLAAVYTSLLLFIMRVL